ncbi:MAG TPA: TonB-dependent receptor [Gammaproteobacteria bacterium]
MELCPYRRPLFTTLLLLTGSGHAAYAETASADPALLDEITVTGAREAQPIAETPATINTIDGEAIQTVRPTHPSQIMNQLPGVWVNITGGEGHQTAIRQPLTTNPVYLYLEDGIPTRSTGFFNHNALYEINVPQAGGIEVSKGPGSALQGSDAIGGVINVLTREPPLTAEASLSLEAGSYGWRRALLSGGDSFGSDGLRGDLNLTHTDGWRDATDYDRQSLTTRWDRATGSGDLLKTVFSYSHIDQQTAGSSTISRDDYFNDPTINYTPISYREVDAYRLSTAYERERGDSLVSLTPYLRYNTMDLLANWSLSYDPTVATTKNSSLGLLGKYRKDFTPLRTRLIAGVDIEHSPGSRFEQKITTTKSGKIYTAYTVGPTLYDYDVTYQGVSPYLQGELSPSEALRVTAGLRYDILGYDYTTNLTTPVDAKHLIPADTQLDYRHTSPKLGATYAIDPRHNLFAGYSHGFRVPSENQLFRQGSAVDTVGLQPVKADNYELGMRTQPTTTSHFDLSLYYLDKKDDILSYKDPLSGATQAVNAGETLHRGVEIGVGFQPAERWQFDNALSYAKHTYSEWVVSGSTDYSGNEMETAPRLITNTRLAHTPALLKGGKVSLEWTRLGRYWLDAANTHEYSGHNLLNLRANYPLAKRWELFGSITNLTDRRFAESASYTVARGDEYAPGMPRTLYLGVQYNWQGSAANHTSSEL